MTSKEDSILLLMVLLIFLDIEAVFATQNVSAFHATSFSEKTEKAQLIFEGKVTSVAAKFDDQQQPLVFYTFEVERILKGSIAGGSNVFTMPIEREVATDERNRFIPLAAIKGSGHYKIGWRFILCVIDNEKIAPYSVFDESQCGYSITLPEDKEAWITRKNEIIFKPKSQTESKRESLRTYLQSRNLKEPKDYAEVMEAFDTIYPDDINIPEPEWDPPAGAKH